jgi:hypothetical protein
VGGGGERATEWTVEPVELYGFKIARELSPGATRWLDSGPARLAGVRDDASLVEFSAPDHPIAPGESWRYDLGSHADDRGEIDAASSAATGKLTSVHVKDGCRSGRIDVHGELRFTKWRVAGELGDVVEGGREQLDVSCEGSLEPGKRREMVSRRTWQFRAKVRVNGPGGAPRTVEVVDEGSDVLKVGPFDPPGAVEPTGIAPVPDGDKAVLEVFEGDALDQGERHVITRRDLVLRARLTAEYRDSI